MDTLAQPRARKPKLPASVDLSRLCDAIVRDRKDLEDFRANRREAIVQLAGKHFAEGGAPVEVPVNLLGVYQDIITRSLVPSNLRVMLSTFETAQEPAVDAMQSWLNEEIVRTGEVESYRRSITDALYCVGIVEVGLADPVDAAMSGWDEEAGQPFMDAIDLDDWFGDMSARRFDRMAYSGHKYRLPTYLANQMYAKGRDKFESSDPTDFHHGGDEKVDTIGRSQGHREEAEDHCDLWQVYLARHRLVLTLRDGGGMPDYAKEPVRIEPWIGPYCGPYHYLGLGTVPGNLMPKAPVMDLIDLHRHYNRAYRKLSWQVDNYKKLLPYQGGNAEDLKRARSEPNGAMFQCDHPEMLKEIEFNVPSNALLITSDHMRQMFSFIGGNLELLGGRAKQSGTVGQDKMLNENAGAGVANMEDAVYAFIQKTQESLMWWRWHHPTKEMKSKIAPPSLPNMSFTRTVRPQDRRGPMPAIKVDPYSLPRQTPQGRIAYINSVLQTVAPMFALLQQQGVVPNMDELIKIFAKYGDEPDLGKIFQVGVPQQPKGGDGGGMPTNTTRTYERTGTAGGPQEQAADLTKNISKMNGPANPNQ